MGCYSQTHKGEVKRSAMYMFKRTGVRSNAKCKPIFTKFLNKAQNTKHTRFLQTQHKKENLHTYLQKHKIKYLHKIFAKTPPNLKRHIAHNVTKLT
jgi:hypothetical protein